MHMLVALAASPAPTCAGRKAAALRNRRRRWRCCTLHACTPVALHIGNAHMQQQLGGAAPWQLLAGGARRSMLAQQVYCFLAATCVKPPLANPTVHGQSPTTPVASSQSRTHQGGWQQHPWGSSRLATVPGRNLTASCNVPNTGTSTCGAMGRHMHNSLLDHPPTRGVPPQLQLACKLSTEHHLLANDHLAKRGQAATFGLLMATGVLSMFQPGRKSMGVHCIRVCKLTPYTGASPNPPAPCSAGMGFTHISAPCFKTTHSMQGSWQLLLQHCCCCRMLLHRLHPQLLANACQTDAVVSDTLLPYKTHFLQDGPGLTPSHPSRQYSKGGTNAPRHRHHSCSTAHS